MNPAAGNRPDKKEEPRKKSGQRTVFHKFVFTYVALVLLITLTLGITSSVLSAGLYNREIEKHNSLLLDQYVGLIEVEAWNKAYSITAALLSGSGMSVSLNQFLLSNTVDLPTINYIRKDLNYLAFEASDIVRAVHVYDKSRDILLSSEFGLKYLNTYETLRDQRLNWLSAVTGQKLSSLWFSSDYTEEGLSKRSLLLVRTYPAAASIEACKGYVAVEMNESYIKGLFSQIVSNAGDRLMMVDGQGNILSETGKSMTGSSEKGLAKLSQLGLTDLDFLQSTQSGGFTGPLDGSMHYFTYSSPFTNGWRLVMATHLESFYAASRYILKTLALICTGSILLGLLVAFLFARKMYTPLRTLTNKLKTISLTQTPSLSGQNEYAFIDSSILRLSDKISTLSKKLEQNLPLIKYNLVVSLINHAVSNRAELEERLELLGLTLQWTSFNVLLIVMDEKLTDMLELKNTQLAKFGLRDQVESLSDGDSLYIAGDTGHNEVAVLLFSRSQDAGPVLAAMEDYLREQHYGNSVSLSLGDWTEDPLKLQEAYRSAKNAAKYKFFMPERILFLSNELCDGPGQPARLDRFVKDFDKALRTGKAASALSPVVEFSQAAASGQFLYDDLNARLLQLISLFSNYAKSLNLKVKDMVDEFEGKFAEISDMREFMEWFGEAVAKILAYRDQQVDERVEDSVGLVKKYINENLGSDLSLGYLAEAAGVSSSYLSRIFKDSIGMNLVDYITSRRMEKAKELLEKTDLHIETIAAQVGFPTHHYFSKRFKQYYGYPPKYFRFMQQNKSE